MTRGPCLCGRPLAFPSLVLPLVGHRAWVQRSGTSTEVVAGVCEQGPAIELRVLSVGLVALLIVAGNGGAGIVCPWVVPGGHDHTLGMPSRWTRCVLAARRAQALACVVMSLVQLC